MLNGEPSTSKACNITESKGKENKEQVNYQDDSDEHMDNSEKKKKGEKSVCVHLELIKITARR